MNKIYRGSQQGWIAALVMGVLMITGLLSLLAYPVTAAPAATELAATSFEEPGVGGQYVDTGDPATDHPLLNNAGEAPVNYTSVGGELGFSSYYYNTRNGVGLTDGDYVGVTDFTGDVGSYPDGAQGFQVSDADGKMTVSLDEVDLATAVAPSVSASYFLVETGWESDDVFRVWVSVNSGELDLINTAGSDIDDLGIEGVWQTVSLDLTGHPTATLHFELDSNASSEAVYLDDIKFVDDSQTLAAAKSATPDSNVAAQDLVTYTVVVSNNQAVADSNVVVTDALPTAVDFAYWVEQPAGATVSGDELAWSGAINANSAVTFTFAVTHVLDVNTTVTNTAYISGANNTAVAIATYDSIASSGDITFVYHDLEDVVQVGEDMLIAGSFNGWTPSGPLTADAAYEVFTITVPGLSGDIEYKYLVDAASGQQWDWVNTANRSHTVIGDATLDDYRNVTPGYAVLNPPTTATTTLGTATADLFGEVYVQSVTDPAGAGRALLGEVGYGDDVDPANWDWFSGAYSGQNGNNDIFQGVITPTSPGVYSFTYRFNGNWGAGNPNNVWTYADTDGVFPGEPFELSNTGVLTVEFDAPFLIINETDADMAGTEDTEFIELYDGGAGNTALDALVVVLYNGSDNLSYDAFDLDGYSTDADGYFVIGGSGVVSADLTVTGDYWLQNGADAVALYVGDAAAFPNDTPLTTDNLLDATVYGTGDPEDAELIALLNAGQNQVDEAANGDKDAHSVGRCPNGTGGQRNTYTYYANTPTPDGPNDCPDLALTVDKDGPGVAAPGDTLVYNITVQNSGALSATNVVLTDTLPLSATYVADNIGAPSNPATGVYVWSLGDVLSQTATTYQLTATAHVSAPVGILTNTVEVATDAAGDNPADNVELFGTAVYPVVSIYDVQTVADPASDDASPLQDQVVWVEGIVTSEPGDIDNPTNLMVIQDPAGGAWSGLALYRDSGFGNYPPGVYLRALGTVSEYYGYTELQMSDSPWAIEVLSSTAVPAPALLSTAAFDDADANTSEPWESVFIEFQDATVTDDALGFGEWAFDDGSGPARADDLGERDNDLSYQPATGDVYQYIRGIGYYSFDNYKLLPRSDADIALLETTPVIEKMAPDVVDPAETFTYTISVENYLGYTLTNAIITDVVPANVTLLSVLDGGIESGGVITWTVASLPDQAGVEVRFVVSAAAPAGDLIVNDAYGVVADNYITPTLGLPISTSVFGVFAIPDVQGADFSSPYEGNILATNGVVNGFFEGNYPGGGTFDGFFIQDTAGGDGNPDTSDGIFVNHGTLDVPVSVGDVVTVTGMVQEFNEYDGNGCFESDGCITQIMVSDPADVEIGVSVALPAPVEIDPPAGDSLDGDMYYETLEGMLTTMPITGVVVGPTSFNTVDVIRGDVGVSRALRGTQYESMPFGVRHYERYGNINGSGTNVPNLITGSTVDSLTGPMGFSYGRYMAVTQEGAPWAAIFEQPAPTTEPTWPAPLANQFSVATFNTLNFDGGSSSDKFDKVIRSIDQMNGPTFLALQEIAVDEVITDVVNALDGLGYSYEYANSHPDVGGHGVAVLWRSDVVDGATWSTDYQGCSAFGSGSSVAYDDYCEGTDLLPLFSRRPVVVTATLTLHGEQETVIVIGNHFKSKLGGAPSDQRRLEQGQFVASLVDGFVANSTPYVMVMGDLNDFEDSPPLQALYASGNLTTTWNMAPAETRYSYIFQGVSQILDHVLVTPALWDWAQDVAPLHANADFPFFPYDGDGTVMWRTSDHDLVAATFAAPVTPAITLDVTLSNDGSCGAADSLTVKPGADVTYCYSVTNTGNISLTDHVISDTVYGEIATIAYDLAPGASVSITETFTVTSTATSTVTWTADNGTDVAMASDGVTVTVEDFYIYMPIIAKP